MTNADKIRNMTDRELAGLLTRLSSCQKCVAKDYCTKGNALYSSCNDCIEDWLKKEETNV